MFNAGFRSDIELLLKNGKGGKKGPAFLVEEADGPWWIKANRGHRAK